MLRSATFHAFSSPLCDWIVNNYESPLKALCRWSFWGTSLSFCLFGCSTCPLLCLPACLLAPDAKSTDSPPLLQPAPLTFVFVSRLTCRLCVWMSGCLSLYIRIFEGLGISFFISYFLFLFLCTFTQTHTHSRSHSSLAHPTLTALAECDPA